MYLPVNTLLQGGKYRIVRYINSGGFGCTYEAEHVMLRKRVAIKEFFVKDFCNRDETTAQVTVGITSKRGLVEKLRGKFIDEARAISQLEHPNIVRVSDVFEENGTAYYVMDYIDGLSLEGIVKREGPLAEERALKYIRQVAGALQHVHNHNRLHLDVKPGNIMIDGSDQAILIDFGASKQYDEVDGENTSTLIGKTPGYAPLEQMGNDVVQFQPATDIYALGATLYKLLTGITPLGANRLASGEELAPLPNGTSKQVAKAIRSAMQINRAKRPQDIATFLAMLNSDSDPIQENEVTVLDVKPRPSYQPEDKEAQTNKSTTGTINGHEWVDLGLSVKWATCNVGASTPSDFGDYFAWGETKPKSEYTVKNSVTYGKNMGSIAGNPQYDAARANWGGSWRLPTWNEIKEFDDKCIGEWTTLNGHKGYKVTGPNGNSIFLPAAGYRHGTSLILAGGYGYYWSATPGEENSDGAFDLGFSSGHFGTGWDGRRLGRSVRPVTE